MATLLWNYVDVRTREFFIEKSASTFASAASASTRVGASEPGIDIRVAGQRHPHRGALALDALQSNLSTQQLH